MGIVLWMVCAAAVFFTIRNIRAGRPAGWIVELFAIAIGALLLGGVATALDFGGWDTLDWRGGIFVLLGSFAIGGAIRGGRLFTRRREEAEKST